MSNRTLIDRARQILDDVRSGRTTVKNAFVSLSGVTSALEMLPYSLVSELRSLVDDLQMVAWNDEEGLATDVEQVLAKIDEGLAHVPTEP